MTLKAKGWSIYFLTLLNTLLFFLDKKKIACIFFLVSLLKLISIIIPTSCLLPKILLLFSEISLRKSYQYPVHTSYLYILYNNAIPFQFLQVFTYTFGAVYTIHSLILFENIVTYINFVGGFGYHPPKFLLHSNLKIYLSISVHSKQYDQK